MNDPVIGSQWSGLIATIVGAVIAWCAWITKWVFTLANKVDNKPSQKEVLELIDLKTDAINEIYKYITTDLKDDIAELKHDVKVIKSDVRTDK